MSEMNESGKIDMYLIMHMYSVRDTKAECYLAPFMMRTDYEAQRAFADSVNREGTLLHDHPEDFVLYKIGSFNQGTGMLIGVEHKSLGKGSDYVLSRD